MNQDSGCCQEETALARKRVASSSLLWSTFRAENVLESRHFFHNLTPFPSARAEIINDLAGFFLNFSTVFLQERFVRARRKHAAPSWRLPAHSITIMDYLLGYHATVGVGSDLRYIVAAPPAIRIWSKGSKLRAKS